MMRAGAFWRVVPSRCIRRSPPISKRCFHAPTAVRSAVGPPSTSSPTRNPPTSTSFSCASTTGRRPSNSFFVRATHDRADVLRIPPNKPPISNIDEQTRNTYVTGEYQHTFSQAMLNQLRAGTQSVGVARRQPPHDRHSPIARVDSWRELRLLHDSGNGDGDGAATSGCRATIA